MHLDPVPDTRDARASSRRATTPTGRLALLALLGVLAALLSPAFGPQAPAQALAKIKCKELVGIAPIDPIKHHNEPDAHVHDHQFFGSTAVLAAGPGAQRTQLTAGGTNCEHAGDTASYWLPVLRDKQTKQVVPVQAFTAYYRPFTGLGSKFGEGMAYPPDTRLIATDDTKGGWNCGQFSAGRSAFSQSIPDCSGLSGKPGRTLTVHISFPSCWDGVLPDHSAKDVGDTNDNEHYAYPVKKQCPAGFPHKMVGLVETIQFAYTGDGTDLELSSDEMMGTTDGQSMHADFWNTWDQDAFERVVRDCVNPGGDFTEAECMSGGDGPGKKKGAAPAARTAPTSSAPTTEESVRPSHGGHHGHPAPVEARASRSVAV
jgi:hypothetical protein